MMDFSIEFRDAIADYTNFIKSQIGMYTDACAGFKRNKTIVEFQAARVQRSAGIKLDDTGKPVMMMVSMEDPSRPDVIHHRIIRATDYIAENSEDGLHEQHHARSVIIFVYHYWDDEIRYRLAKAKGVDKSLIKSDIMGDLRKLRQAILHDKNILSKNAHESLKLLKLYLQPDQAMIFTHSIMHQIFALIEKDITRITLEAVGPLPNGMRIEDFKQVAIQRGNITN